MIFVSNDIFSQVSIPDRDFSEFQHLNLIISIIPAHVSIPDRDFSEFQQS